MIVLEENLTLLFGKRCAVQVFGVLDEGIAAIVRIASVRIYDDGSHGDDFVVEFHSVIFLFF